MKNLVVLIVAVMITGKCFSQNATTSQSKLDSISTLVIHYLQAKQADSIYALTGTEFRGQLSEANFKSISEQQLFPINDFKNVSFEKNINGINKYKVSGSPVLQLFIGLDAENMIQTLLVQPYSAN